MKKLVKTIKRNLALFTLAMADVSKSALANQKNIGLDGAAESISVSVLSETKQTINDITKGRRTSETQQLATLWWETHVRMQRMGWIDGVHRELTDQEWRARWEQHADPANASKGPVVFISELRVSFNDNTALEYEGNKVILNQEKRLTTRKTNVEFTTTPGFYFPLDTVHTLYVRRDENENYTFELHTELTANDEVSYGLTLDPDYAHLLTGLQRVALVQEEYSGLVLRAFAVSGPPVVRLVHGRAISEYFKNRALDFVPDNNTSHLVLSYPAREVLIIPAEARVLFGGEAEVCNVT